MKEDKQKQDTKNHEPTNPEKEHTASIRDVKVLIQPLTKLETFGLHDLMQRKDK